MARKKHPIVTDSFITGADLSAAQYHLVKLDAAGLLVLAGAGEEALGVLLDDPPLGEPGLVGLEGIMPVIAGAAIATFQTKLMSNAAGRAIAAVATNIVVGRNLEETAAADGSIFTAHIQPGSTALV